MIPPIRRQAADFIAAALTSSIDVVVTSRLGASMIFEISPVIVRKTSRS